MLLYPLNYRCSRRKNWLPNQIRDLILSDTKYYIYITQLAFRSLSRAYNKDKNLHITASLCSYSVLKNCIQNYALSHKYSICTEINEFLNASSPQIFTYLSIINSLLQHDESVGFKYNLTPIQPAVTQETRARNSGYTCTCIAIRKCKLYTTRMAHVGAYFIANGIDSNRFGT